MSARLYHPTSRGGLYGTRERPMPPGANNQLLYTLDEGSTPWANKGRAGTLNMTATSGTPTARRMALFSYGMDFNGNSGATTDSLATATTSVGETTGVWSASLWVMFRSFPAQFSSLFGKQYRGDGSWTTPFTAFKIGLTNAANGSWDANVTVGGTGIDCAITGKSDRVTLNRWHLLAATFDKNSLRAYLDGTLVGTQSVGSNVSTDWGTHGRWYIGGNPQSTGDYFDGRIDDVRFDWEVFSEAYFNDMYKCGMGWFEGSP